MKNIEGKKGFILGCAMILVLNSCGEKKEIQTPTSGYITVRGSDQTLPLMMEEAYAFMDLYVKAKILVLGSGSNHGLASIFIDSAQIAVSTRPMTTDERLRADSSGLFQVNEYKIAKDGIAIVVNPLNPVTHLTLDQVIRIFTGKITNWSQVRGKNWPIKVCIWDENAGTYTYFQDSVLKGANYAKQAYRFNYTEEMIRTIGNEEDAIGLISMARLYKSWSPLIEDMRIKALALRSNPKAGFVLPDESTVNAGIYPLVRYIYLYTAYEPKGLDGGFITFLTSSAGQKIVAANGFVPITVPVKYLTDSL